MRGLLIFSCLIWATSYVFAEEAKPRKIVLIAGKKSHGPGAHDYERTMRLFKVMLDNSNVADRVRVEVHENGWPDDEKTLDDADTIVFYSDGRDGDKFTDAPFVLGNRMEVLQKQIDRGCGFMTMHFSTFVTDKQGEKVLDWVGGYFDWEDDEGKRNWYSKISQVETLELASRDHPISRGVPRMLQIRDEVYWKLRFRPDDNRLTPIWKALDVKDEDKSPHVNTVGWAVERPDGGRGFGTSVGHGYRLWSDDGMRKLFLNAIVWTARAEVPEAGVDASFYSDDEVKKALSAVEGSEKAVAAKSPEVPLVEGRFGKAIDAKQSGLLVPTKAESANPPLTVQCWTKLNSKQAFNILVASEEKSSPTHWELYSYAGSGDCSVFLPGRGGEFKSDVDIADGKWHQVGLTLEAEGIRLFVDGKQVLDRPLPKLDKKSAAGKIAIGRLVEGTIGCDGLIDDVHLLRGVHLLREVPKKASERHEDTVLLLPLDDMAELAKLQARASVPRPGVSGSQGNHWGEEAIGIKWKEEDSRDDRWKEADIGRFLASSLPLGSQHGTVAKGLSIRLGDKQEATVCYDTANMKIRAAWTGGFLKFTPARYGLIMPPLIDGEPMFLCSESPGWEGKVQYRGLEKFNERVVLKYTVDDTGIEESPWVQKVEDHSVVLRSFHIQPTKKTLVLKVAGKTEGKVEIRAVKGGFVGTVTSGDNAWVFQIRGPEGLRWNISGEELQLVIPAHEKETDFQLSMVPLPADQLDEFEKPIHARDVIWASIKRPFEQSHPEITTRGKLGDDSGALAVDTITLPFDNPYKALFFTSGHDVLASISGKQALAVCTVHGDVWIVTGIDDKLETLSWTRYATGLFQPLGLVCKRDGIYVLGRDQITRLCDDNNDLEADRYECFSNAIPTSPGGHDYTTCLETDEEGNFYFITAREGVWRLSADGQKLENLAGGLRNPNGLGVGPGPIITASPQEGNWTPATYIAEVKPGDYFGFGGPKVTPDRPLGWTKPLCFIPRRRDNSSGGQVWVTSDRWGPLAGQILHFSYGQCRMMLVPREVINGQPQGGTVEMSPLFESGAMRGRFSPYDGQLYVSGLRGWTTAATQDGCLQRVRYTGKPLHMPVNVRTLRNGLAITFSDPLHRESAEDTGNYHLEQWNYRYAESYGSPDFKVSDPKQEGHDVVRVESATLLEDDKTVFLEIKDLKPVNQLSIGFALQAASGNNVRNSIAYTIHNLGNESMDPKLLNRTKTTGRLSQAEEKALRQGLSASVVMGTHQGSFVAHTAAVDTNQHIGIRIPKDAITHAKLEGYLHVPLKGKYTFASSGKSQLLINDVKLKDVSSEQADSRFEPIELRGGHNKITVVYDPRGWMFMIPLRLTWAQDDGPKEPIPPTALFHDAGEPLLRQSQSVSLGRKLFTEHQCVRCHISPRFNWPEGIRVSPSLGGVQKRVTREWLAQWILNPEKTRNHATMPVQFEATKPEDRKAVADIVAYLTADARPSPAQSAASEDQAIAGRELYENLGCIACHKLTPPETEDGFKRISLHYSGAKFLPGKLKEYLLSPLKDHPTGRMPDFKLSNEEAEVIVAYLRQASQGKVESLAELEQGDYDSGAKHFKERHCVNCHNEPRKHPVHTSFERPHHGCLTKDPGNRRRAPNWDFSQQEINALRAYIEHKKGLDVPTLPAQISGELYADLRCNACHKRDGIQGDRLAILADESEDGRTPELLPDLTWAGEKLHRDWAEKQIAGKVDYRSRPWLEARMPAFPAYAEALASGMEAEHAPHSGEGETPSEESIKIGKQLTLKENLDCRQCHGVGNLEPMGDDKTKLAPGINFGHMRERLRHDFYQRFVLDPPKWDVSTRMPKLAVDGRTTKVTSHYDGDAARQLEAIWHYLHTVKKPTEQPAHK